MAFGISAGAYLMAGAAVAGGAISASASKSAAKTQAGAAREAAAMQQEQQNQVRSDLQPYRDLGANNITALQNALMNPLLQTSAMPSSFNSVNFKSPPASGFNFQSFKAPTAAEAAATPGYQFTLENGLKAAQNSASARGLGASGAAIKGAERYATGLADSTYNDAYNRAQSEYSTNRANALSNFTTNYGIANDQVNRLLGIVQTGANASAQTGQLGTASTNSIAGTLTSGAAATAAGQVGSANALNSGISSAISGYQNQQLLNSLMNKGGGSTLYGGTNLGLDYRN